MEDSHETPPISYRRIYIIGNRSPGDGASSPGYDPLSLVCGLLFLTKQCPLAPMADDAPNIRPLHQGLPGETGPYNEAEVENWRAHKHHACRNRLVGSGAHFFSHCRVRLDHRHGLFMFESYSAGAPCWRCSHTGEGLYPALKKVNVSIRATDRVGVEWMTVH